MGVRAFFQERKLCKESNPAMEVDGAIFDASAS